MGETERVFVYGTLRRGECRDLRTNFGGGLYLGQGSITGRLYELDDFPGVRLDPAGGRVVGEIFAVSARTLAALDELEGVNAECPDEGEYRRVRVLVERDSGAQECWVYEIGERHVVGRQQIVSGDWVLDREGELNRGTTNGTKAHE